MQIILAKTAKIEPELLTKEYMLSADNGIVCSVRQDDFGS